MFFVACFALPARGLPKEPEISSQPIGSAFFRHLAYDYHLDLQDLVKLEKRGFGRAETISLILISSATGTYFKDLAKRRLKEKILLRNLAAEANLNYETLQKEVIKIKTTIESKGDKNLPPPVFQEPISSIKKEEAKEFESSPHKEELDSP